MDALKKKKNCCCFYCYHIRRFIQDQLKKKRKRCFQGFFLELSRFTLCFLISHLETALFELILSKQTFESFHCKKITPIVMLRCYLSDLFVLSWEMVIATSDDHLVFAH